LDKILTNRGENKSEICMSLKLPSITETIAQYKSLTLSPVDVCQAILSNIDKNNKTFVAYNFVDSSENLLKQASESAVRYKNGKPCGSLDGIFVSIKDILAVRGWKTMYGATKYLDVEPDDSDHPCVQRLREEGAIFVGKTTTPTFGWKGVTDSPIYGITRNPYNKDRTSGGSSGGAAVSVALGMCHFAIGTDGGGSVRIPSSFCGISTIKPTYALIGHTLSKFGSLSTIGPMCSSIEDVAYSLNIIGKSHVTDWHSIRPKCVPINYLDGLDKSLKGIKIAWSLDMNGFVKSIDQEVKETFMKSLEIFEHLGAELTETFPDFGKIPFFETFNIVWETGCANSFLANEIDVQDENYDLGLRQNAINIVWGS
jgi:aspartyl-tRNA(Asn)/glutamyl-tRNA(Gln) amidotransferase subunit A